MSDKLIGAKAILRHLREKWDWHMGREWLWRLSRRRADPVPVALQLRGRRGSVIASRKQIDSWVKRNTHLVRHKRVPAATA